MVVVKTMGTWRIFLGYKLKYCTLTILMLSVAEKCLLTWLPVLLRESDWWGLSSRMMVEWRSKEPRSCHPQGLRWCRIEGCSHQWIGFPAWWTNAQSCASRRNLEIDNKIKAFMWILADPTGFVLCLILPPTAAPTGS